MQIAFVRHGERRKSEVDPELTSYGIRMVEETAQWLDSIGFRPDLSLCTTTVRTEQTADTILSRIPSPSRERIANAPELQDDWERWIEELSQRDPCPDSVLLVGHHPTLEMLLRCYGPTPVVVSRHHFAVGLLLAPGSNGWSITQAWPGRRG
jgi:phosphohistidine phosphatase SixA